MHTRIRRLIATGFFVIAVAACSAAPAAALRTAPGAAQACMDALMTGTLVMHPQSGLGINSGDGDPTAVEWPFGYTARNELGRVVLVDETGKVVAKVGDEISIGGGFGNQFWHACGGVFVVTPAS